MQISIVNHTMGRVADDELQRVIRAINRQIAEDFAPYWGMSAVLRLEGRSADRPETMLLADLRGDAVIYLWNETDVDDAVGYHEANAQGVPFGFVFTDIAQQIGEPWSTTLSHEALELIADPETNLLVMGPHPDEKRDVFHWFEMCDAVQDETYLIDGVAVSNFVLPLFFTGTRSTDEVGARNDFLGRSYEGRTLKSFGINPGGYIGFYDPKKKDHDTFMIRGDGVALMRMKSKSRAKQSRRAVRYQTFSDRNKMRAPEPKVSAAAVKAAGLAATADSSSAVVNAGERKYVSMRTQQAPAKRAKKPAATGHKKSTRRRSAK